MDSPTDYVALPPDGRNLLRFLFTNPNVRAKQNDWQSVARFVVGAFRSDVARAGLVSEGGHSSRNSVAAVPNSKRYGVRTACTIMATAA